EIKALLSRNPLRKEDQLATATVSLVAMERGGERANIINLSAGTRFVRLEFGPGKDHRKRARIELSTPEGKQVWVGEGFVSSGATNKRILAARAPASIFTESDYLIGLSTRNSAGQYEPVRTYSIRVLRK